MIGDMTPFIGVVQAVENGKDGRLKVRAFGFHPIGVVADEDLPWAYMVNGTYGGIFKWPKKGDMVFGLFLDGRDAQHPITLGTLSTGVFMSLPMSTVASGKKVGTYDNVTTTGDPLAARAPAGTPITAEEEEALWARLEAQEASRRAAAGLPREFSAEERAAIRGILASEGGDPGGNLATILNRSYYQRASVIDIVFATDQFTPAAAASIGVNDALAGEAITGGERFLGGYINGATSLLTTALDRYNPYLEAGVNYFGADDLTVPGNRTVWGEPYYDHNGQANEYQIGPTGFTADGRNNFEVFLDRHNLR